MSRASARGLASPAFERVLGEVGPRTDGVWLAGNAIGLGLTLVAAYATPAHGLFFAYLAVLARIGLYLYVGGRPGGAYFDAMLRLGLVAGVLELFADYMLVHWLPTGQLIYLTSDAILLASPIYMPLAWACVIVEFGYVPIRVYSLMRRSSPAPGPAAAAIAASLVGGLVAGGSIGLYEYFAFRAGWWKYAPAHIMIGPYCAAFIPLGEALMFLGILPVFAAMLRGPDPRRSGALAWGAAFAILIAAGYLVAYGVLEGLA